MPAGHRGADDAALKAVNCQRACIRGFNRGGGDHGTSSTRSSPRARDDCVIRSRQPSSRLAIPGDPEEIASRLIPEPETPSESGILWAGPDVNAPGRVESMAMNQDDSQAGQRLPAPTIRWAGGMRAVLDLDLQSEQLAHPHESRFNVCTGGRFHRQSPAATKGRAPANHRLDTAAERRPAPQRPRRRPHSPACDVRIGCG